MSAWAEHRSVTAAARRTRSEERLAPLWVRLVMFFVVTLLSALAYERVLFHAPAGAAVAVAAVATACGAALTVGLDVVERTPHARATRLWGHAMRAGVVVAVVLLTLELGLLAVGVPVRLVAPWRWGALASAVAGGVAQLGSWPYLGTSLWARLSVLMLLVPTTTLMALLFFWPARAGAQPGVPVGAGARAGIRSVSALAIAAALAVCGMTNAPSGGWRAQGLLLLVLVVAWLWLPTLRRIDTGRALAWTIACAVPALILAPPLSGSHGWIPLSGEGHDPIVFQWDQLYGPLNRSPEPGPTLLTAHASQPPGMLRVTSLDRFDGLRFIRSDTPPRTAATDIPAGAETSWFQTAAITIGGLRSDLLVGGAGITTHVAWHGRDAGTIDRAPDGTLSLQAPLASGASYSVVSYSPKPSVTQLRAAPGRLPSSYQPYTEFELPPASARYAAGAGRSGPVAERILASPYGPMYTLARRLAAGAGSSYEVVARVERYLLTGGYVYDEHPPAERYPLEAFLFVDRRGYCEQFSGAMTLMLRMDGIPARVGVGFAPALARTHTTAASEPLWTATALQAHAWVEVFFSGIGWVQFDPTPAGSGTGAGAGGPSSGGLVPILPSSTGTEHTPHAGGRQLPSYLADTIAVARPRAGRAPSHGRSAWQWALLGLLAVAAGWMIVALARARSARAPAVTGGDAGHETAVRELERVLRGFAWPLRPGTTLTQIAQRLDRAAQSEAAAYVRRLRDRRFGPAPPLTESELSAARSERVALRRAVSRGSGLRGRLRALRLLPPRAPSL